MGGYDENLFCEDYDMFLRISQVYQAVYMPLVVAKYRICEKSFVRRTRGSCERITSAIDMFLKVIEANQRRKEITVAAKKRLSNHVQQLYRTNCKKRVGYSLKILAVHKGFKVCCLVMGLLLKIPYAWLAFPTHLGRGILKRIRQ